MAIAIHIFNTVVYKKDTTSSWKFFICANIICWLVPGIIVGAAYMDDVIGADNNTATASWCWLKHNNNRYVLWIFLSGKGWEFLCYLIATSVYVLLKWNRKLNHNRERFKVIQDSLRNEDQNYLYVWLVLYILRLWGSVRSMMALAKVDETDLGSEISSVLKYMQAIGDPGQAFCNFILFCVLDKTVRDRVFYTRCEFCCTGSLPEPGERTSLLWDRENSGDFSETGSFSKKKTRHLWERENSGDFSQTGSFREERYLLPQGQSDVCTSDTAHADVPFLSSPSVANKDCLERSGKHSSVSGKDKNSSVTDKDSSIQSKNSTVKTSEI